MTTKIVGGSFVEENEALFMVYLRNLNGILICGGSLISPYTVVTAAVCVEDVVHLWWCLYGGLTVVAKTIHLEGSGKRYAIKRIEIHPNYTREILSIDAEVAVITVSIYLIS